MRIHLIDGTYELFRAHFSRQPDRRSPDGRDVKATVGLVSSLLGLLSDPSEAVTHLAVAFDNPIRSFRNRLFAGYKTEEGVPPALLAQFDPAEEAAKALGVVVWSMDEWEADDAIATAAARWRGQVEQVRILSPDKDFGQCLRDRRVVQMDRRRNREIDEQTLRAVRGIGPESIPDWLALVGDTADGIPGLPGFGEKTSATLLARYLHIEDIPINARDWAVTLPGAERLAEVLKTHRQEALLYRRLATLIEDVPLTEALDDLRWRGAPRETFEQWCDALGADTLKSRPPRWQ